MKYGHFDAEKKEYVIERPDTPLPWINYLGAEQYCALFSNTAGGYSFHVDPKEQRILRYRYDNIPMDRGGRYVYIKDNVSGDFWSNSWQPVMKDQKKYKYQCRHGLGYSVISTVYADIKTETTYLVPIGENCEIWMMEITNEGKKPRDLALFSFVEFCLWNALNDMTDFQRTYNIGEAEYHDGIILHTSEAREWRHHFAYFYCSEKVVSFDTKRDAFLGPYGSLEAPAAVVNGKCSNSKACGWTVAGSHHVPLKLKPGQKKIVIFVLGINYDWDKDKYKKLVKKYSKKEAVVAELKKLAEHWDHILDKYTVQTPDEEVNLFVNTWNQYQCQSTFNWSRSASYYEAGIRRGMGFRDSNQDTLGFVHQIPGKVKQRIIDLTSTQFEAGDCYHQYSPLTKKGNGGGYSDDQLWLIFSTASYIKETGDVKFLKELVPFDTGLPAAARRAKAGKKATMYEHMARAVNYSNTHLGKHKIPLAGFADWNDCLNLKSPDGKQGESVLVAEMLVGAAHEMARFAELWGEKKEVKKFLDIADKMRDQINKVAWDGAWYMRAFNYRGEPVGSHINKEGKIYLETQPWAIMAGVAPHDRAFQTMDSVDKHLATKYGIVLQQPAYKKWYPELGGVSTYPPGLKENAAIFCHPNPWAMVAECILGRGDIAFDYYKAILPSAHNDDAHIRRTEPYVYCQMIAGPDHPDFGEGKNSWLTGTAAWNFVAISQWILGIRPDYNGLIVDPCIPKKWGEFKVKRHFRGCDYEIHVKNPKHINKGVRLLAIDGKNIAGNIIPPLKDGKTHKVEVVMG